MDAFAANRVRRSSEYSSVLVQVHSLPRRMIVSGSEVDEYSHDLMFLVVARSEIRGTRRSVMY
jgi:hypothetical protein